MKVVESGKGFHFDGFSNDGMLNRWLPIVMSSIDDENFVVFQE